MSANPNLNPPSEPQRDDPFDLSKLRLDQSFTETAGVKKLLTTVPVRKPNPQDFVRVHAGEDYRDDFALIELKDDRETYLVLPSIAREIPGEFFMATIRTAINRQGNVFLSGRSACRVRTVKSWNGTARQRRRRRSPPTNGCG